MLTDIKVQGRETIVARKQELRLAHLLGQGKAFFIGCESERTLAVALVDLTQHDQWYCQVIDQSQTTVKVDGPACRLKTFRFAAIRQGAISDGQIGIEPRFKSQIADFFGNIQSSEAGVDAARRVERTVENAEIRVAATGVP